MTELFTVSFTWNFILFLKKVTNGKQTVFQSCDFFFFPITYCTVQSGGFWVLKLRVETEKIFFFCRNSLLCVTEEGINQYGDSQRHGRIRH